MISKSFDAIVLEDLERLIQEEVIEGKSLEYKRELPGQADGGNVKILKAISSFANTAGGDLLYGVRAEDGIPVELIGLERPNLDEITQRIENLCRDNLEPRLRHLQIKFVPINDARAVLVIRTSKSWHAPHRVTAGGHSHFYGRNSAGSYPLDVGELKSAFTFSEEIAERIRAFRIDRIAALSANETPIPMLEGAKLVLHIVPLEGYTSNSSRINIQGGYQSLTSISPIGARVGVGIDRINLDGLLIFMGANANPSRAYVQIYRNGTIEAVAIQRPGDQRSEIFDSYEYSVLASLNQYIGLFREIGISPPFYVMLSLTNARGYVLGHSPMRRFFAEEYPPLRGDGFTLPEVSIENVGGDLAALMKPIFDLFWNAFGYPRSHNYDEQGNLLPDRPG